MKHATRGLAMTETAIVMAVVLLALFGGVQMAVIGYMQAAADGASFVAAHAQALNSSANGPAVAQTPFPIVGGNVTMGAPSGAVSASTSLTTGGLLMMGDLPPTYNVYGGDVEPTFSGGTGGANGTFAYNAGFNITPLTKLKNFCSNTGTCAARAIYLAQRLDSTGNGLNGQYKEWTCHLNAYQQLQKDLPATIGTGGWTNPATGTLGVAGSIFDPTGPSSGKNVSDEGVIYAADNGSKNSGMNC